MIVLLDMDGVVADFEAGNAQLFTELGLNASFARRRKTWCILASTPKDYHERVLAGWHAPGFFANLSVIPGALEGYQALVAKKHDVFFCTSPLRNHATCASEKISWVSKHFGEEASHRVIISNDKTLVHGDVLVDDRPDIHGVKTPTWRHILFAQPYNEHTKAAPGRVRCGWDTLLEHVS